MIRREALVDGKFLQIKQNIAVDKTKFGEDACPLPLINLYMHSATHRQIHCLVLPLYMLYY